jgi:hypothetical protein
MVAKLLSLLCLLTVFQQRSPAQEVAVTKFDSVPETCPVTRPPNQAFSPPPPYYHQLGRGGFWYGSDQLWTELPTSGIWRGLHLNYARTPATYSRRVALWRNGYDRHTEPHPNLQIKGRRLDLQAEPLVAGRAEGDSLQTYPEKIKPEPPSFMVVGVDLPTLGCWEVTAKYKSQTLTFVVWVTDKE